MYAQGWQVLGYEVYRRRACGDARRRWGIRRAAARPRGRRPHQSMAGARPRSEPGSVGPVPTGPESATRRTSPCASRPRRSPREPWTPASSSRRRSSGSMSATGRSTVVARFPDEARAMLADAPPGPLHGVPVLVKDMFQLPWYAPRDGAPGEAAPPGESAVYRRLRDAGAVIVGIAQCHYWGAGSTGHASAWGPLRQSVEPGALRRRIVGRISRGGRRAPGGRRGRDRWRRKRAPPLRLLRCDRDEGDVRRNRGLTATHTATPTWARSAPSAATPPTPAFFGEVLAGR